MSVDPTANDGATRRTVMKAAGATLGARAFANALPR
jgi:hypothetical protein